MAWGKDMIRFMKQIWNDRRGNALVLTAATLPLLIGSAGLATDTIQWTVWKRQIQRAADGGALAGVRGLVAGQTPIVSCAPNSPVGRDLEINNHVLLGNDNTDCAVENSPGDGPWAGDPNAVRVTLSVQRRLGFSSMFLATPPTITARATATVVATGEYCVISLERTNATGLTFQGNATVDMGCGMATNSRGTSAVNATGSATVTASPIAAVGGISGRQVFSEGTVIQPYSSPQEDPFAHIDPPSNFPSGNCPNFRVNSNATQSSLTANVDYRAMEGGYYCMGDMTLNGSVTLPSGVYVLDGGSLSIGAQANVTCNGCTFIFTSRTAETNPQSIGGIQNINGGATIAMSAPTSGTYAGIMMYQDRRALIQSGNQANQINGNSSSGYEGAFYFPSQRISFNGTSGMNTQCVQVVGRQVSFSGNTSITNVCPSSGARAFDATTIRLVA
jgi:Flp pilus assembly protein TadG